MNDKKYYLAYGSNLNLLRNRCPYIEYVGATVLDGYALAFRGSCDNYAYLTIEPQKDGIVPVGIFKISREEEQALDYYEGFPLLYGKVYMPITIAGEDIEALIYVMNRRYSYHIPSQDYFVECLRGYMHFKFDLTLLSEAFRRSSDNRGLIRIKK
jgi:gamma-glutamylcyclotransferase (GGCT)/AIG2-like uncharacterized protein YtfP